MSGSTWLQENEDYAISGNWGHFNDHDAFAVTGAARINENWSANAGVGLTTDGGQWGARAGIRYGWGRRYDSLK